VYDNARRADRFFICKGEEVNRPPIIPIELDICGHALFAHEYAHADGKRLLQFRLARHSSDLQIAFELFSHGRHFQQYSNGLLLCFRKRFQL